MPGVDLRASAPGVVSGAVFSFTFLSSFLGGTAMRYSGLAPEIVPVVPGQHVVTYYVRCLSDSGYSSTIRRGPPSPDPGRSARALHPWRRLACSNRRSRSSPRWLRSVVTVLEDDGTIDDPAYTRLHGSTLSRAVQARQRRSDRQTSFAIEKPALKIDGQVEKAKKLRHTRPAQPFASRDVRPRAAATEFGFPTPNVSQGPASRESTAWLRRPRSCAASPSYRPYDPGRWSHEGCSPSRRRDAAAVPGKSGS